MHKLHILFLMLLLLLLWGCEKKENNEHAIPIENTTEVLGGHTQNLPRDENYKVTRHAKDTYQARNNSVLEDTFILKDIKNKSYTVHLSNKTMTIKENSKAIVLMTFFASWCPPCVYEIPYLNDLQRRYHKDLFVAGVIVHDTLPLAKLKSFLAKHEVAYYISNAKQNNDFASLTAKTLHLSHNFPIPLTVMYVNGKYFTHYEDIVPIEMITYDIEEALKTLKQTR